MAKRKNNIEKLKYLATLQLILVSSSFSAGYAGWLFISAWNLGAPDFGGALMFGVGGIAISEIIIAYKTHAELHMALTSHKARRAAFSPQPMSAPIISPKSPNSAGFGSRALNGAIGNGSIFLSSIRQPRFRDDWVVVNGKWERKRGFFRFPVFGRNKPPNIRDAKRIAKTRKPSDMFDTLYFAYAGIQIPATAMKKFLRRAYLYQERGKGLSARYWVHGNGSRLQWWRREWYNPIMAIIDDTQRQTGLQLIFIGENNWQVLLYDNHATFFVVALVNFPNLFDEADFQRLHKLWQTP